jgi:hypothetical protein
MKNTSATSPTYLLRIFSLICVCASLHLSLPAQDFDRYQRLRCEGTIPPALLGSVTAKYQKRVAELEKSKEADEQKAKEDFLLESSFFLDGLLRGGSVFFNDPVSEYLNNLKDFILRDNAELRDKIQVFTLKSTAVNAFATNEGVVLVTTGLLAHVRNEAALAMVMCHEFQHYLQRHAMKRHLVAKQNKKERVYRDDEALDLETCRYSRDQEMEADTLGLKLFLSTGYSSAALDDCFDLLLFAPYHYDLNAVWDKSFFESANLKFPAAFHLDTIAAIQPDSTEDDTRHTHPNVSKRRAAAKAVLAAQGAVEGPLYILGEERFKSITTICRFEQSALMLQRQRYEATIFNTFLLLREYPESYFLRKTVVQALYGLARHRNENEFNGVHLPPDFVEGGHQPLHHFFDLIEKPALNILALRFASDLCRQYPTDKSLADIRADLLKDMHFFHPEKTMLLESQDAPAQYYDSLQGFGAVQPSVVMVKSEKDDEGNSEEVYENTYKPRQRNYADNYYRYGLAEFLRDSAHTPLVAKAKEKAKKLKAVDAEQSAFKARKTYNKQLWNASKLKHLGIDDILLLSPKYIVYNEYRRKGVDQLDSEQERSRYVDMIQSLSQSLDLSVTLLDPTDLQADEVGKFNDIVALKSYVDGNAGDGDVPMVNFDQQIADSLSKKYNTRHLAYMFMVDVKEKYRLKLGDLLGAIIVWPVGVPILLLRYAIPIRSVVVGNMVYDLKESKAVMVEYRKINGRATRTRERVALYNTLFQIKSSPKKNKRSN